jgi:hypothetical protein
MKEGALLTDEQGVGHAFTYLDDEELITKPSVSKYKQR